MDPVTLGLISLGGLALKQFFKEERTIEDFLQHYWIVSRTRHGKTTYIRENLIPDFKKKAPNGSVILFETKDEETIRMYLNSLPESEHNRTLVYAPSDMKRLNRWIGLNIIQKEGRYPAESTVLTNELLACFERAFGDSIKSNSRDIIRSGTQSVLEVLDQASLLEVYKMFNDKIGAPIEAKRPNDELKPNTFRSEIVNRLRSPFLKNYFNTNFIYPTIRTMDIYNPIYNKLRAITNDPISANCLCQINGIDLRTLIDDGWNILFFFPKGELGPETSRILSSIAFSKVQLAIQSRTMMDRDTRLNKPVMIIADEFQDYASNNTSFHEFLNQAAGFGASLVLSHQHIGQEGITPSLINAIRGNVGNIVCGRIGDLDSEIMSDIMRMPNITPPKDHRKNNQPYREDVLKNLPQFQFVEKLTKNGKSQNPRNIRVGSFKCLNESYSDLLRRQSLELFGLPTSMVRRSITERLNSENLVTYGLYNKTA